jgi:hypothetical protein
MPRFCGFLALAVLIAGCGSSAPRSVVKAESSTTDEAVTTTTTQAGATGPTGPTGAAGAPGAPGGPGISGYEIVRATKSQTSAENRVHDLMDLSASCPAGKSILSGGASFTLGPEEQNQAGPARLTYRRSEQVDESTWAVTLYAGEAPDQSVKLTVTIACAVVS